MIIRLAEEKDMDDWRAVADNVAVIFGNPDMANDPEFIEYAHSKIKQGGALTAVDEKTGKNVGFIGFSFHSNRVTWFGVLESFRNRGLGGQLLKAALEKLDAAKDITVDTFREDYFPGQPARHLYMKHGFVESDNTLQDSFGNERCQLVIRPK